jgi:hypothetical protein
MHFVNTGMFIRKIGSVKRRFMCGGKKIIEGLRCLSGRQKHVVLPVKEIGKVQPLGRICYITRILTFI